MRSGRTGNAARGDRDGGGDVPVGVESDGDSAEKVPDTHDATTTEPSPPPPYSLREEGTGSPTGSPLMSTVIPYEVFVYLSRSPVYFQPKGYEYA